MSLSGKIKNTRLSEIITQQSIEDTEEMHKKNEIYRLSANHEDSIDYWIQQNIPFEDDYEIIKKLTGAEKPIPKENFYNFHKMEKPLIDEDNRDTRKDEFERPNGLRIATLEELNDTSILETQY